MAAGSLLVIRGYKADITWPWQQSRFLPHGDFHTAVSVYKCSFTTYLLLLKLDGILEQFFEIVTLCRRK